MGKVLKSILAIVALTFVVASCNTSGCLDNGSAIPLAGFYSSATAQSITIDSIAIVGLHAPGDSAIVRAGAKNSSVYLPMNPTSTSTSWVISYKQQSLNYPELNDTVTFNYEALPYFASEECGAMYYYDVATVDYTCHLIDSVCMTSQLITNADIETIKIYFRTSTAEGGQRQ